MSITSSFLFLILFLGVSFVRADPPWAITQQQWQLFQQQLSDLQALVQDHQDRNDVLEAQAAYNFHLDKFFDAAVNNATVQAPILDVLMESFCPDPIFKSWTAAGPGFANGQVTELVDTPPSATTKAGVRATYAGINAGLTFNGVSQHNVMNPIVQFSQDNAGRRTATLTARLVQNALFGPALGNTWADIMGYYQNVWTKLPSGKWCMSVFFAANDWILQRIDTVNGDKVGINVYQFSVGTNQLPYLPQRPIEGQHYEGN
jgi:hypothetical protein